MAILNIYYWRNTMIGQNIKRLRLCKGDTQEKLADVLHISTQAISKWENELSSPDISLLPQLADYFGITIDELMGHKLNAYTYKEQFVRLMYHSGVLTLDTEGAYRINTEKFSINAQIAKIGECFADLICENHLCYDMIMGLAYHGLAFSTATVCALFQKYGVTTSYSYDRKLPDSRGRMICGYTPRPGDNIIVIDDMIGSGKTIDERLNRLTKEHDVNIVAVISIVDTKAHNKYDISGSDLLLQKYGARVYTLVSDNDIQAAMKKGII